MQKMLCIVSLVLSVIVALLFMLDWLAGVPFGGIGGLWGYLGMISGAVIVGVFSVLTIPECR